MWPNSKSDDSHKAGHKDFEKAPEGASFESLTS